MAERRSFIVHALWGMALVLVYHVVDLVRMGSCVPGLALSDMGSYHLPVYAWVRGVVLEGRLPIWNPLIFCGFPQWAEGQLSLLVPWGWLLALPLSVCLTLWIVLLHVLVFVAGFWWLAGLGLRPVACLFGAVSVAMSGAVVLRITGGHPNIIAACVWGFVLVGAWSLWWRGASARMLCLAAGAFGMLLFACHIQMAYYMALWWTLISLASWPVYNVASGVRWLKGHVFVVGVGAAVGAALLFPQWELSTISLRTKLSVYEAGTFSFPLENFLLAIFPGAYGFGATGEDVFAARPYLGRWLYGWETGLVVNPLVLAMAALALMGRGGAGWRGSRWRAVMPYVVAGAVCALLAVGRQLPFFWMAFSSLPGFSLFRVPARLMAPAMFSLVAVAAVGLDAWLGAGDGSGEKIAGGRAAARDSADRRVGATERARVKGRSFGKPGVAWMVAVVASVLVLVVGVPGWLAPGSAFGGPARALGSLAVHGWGWDHFPELPAGAQLSQFHGDASPVERGAVFGRAMALAGGVWLLLLGVVWGMARLGWSRVRRGMVLTGAAAAWCVAMAVPYSFRAKVGETRLTPEQSEKIREVAGGGRMMMLGNGNRNELMAEGISQAGGYAALLGKRQNHLLALASGAASNSAQYQGNAWAISPVMRALGVTGFYTTDEGQPEGLGAPEWSGGGVRVWRAPWDGQSSLFAAREYRAAKSEEDALAQLARFSSTAEVVLEAPVGDATSATVFNGELKSAIERPGSITVLPTSAFSGTVVLLESLYPGWKGYADGVRQEVAPAQVAFQAMQVREPARALKFMYQPASLRMGMFVSLCGTMLLGLLVAWRLPAWPAVAVVASRERRTRAPKGERNPAKRDVRESPKAPRGGQARKHKRG
ncbi:MAG: hypothetical protein ACR2IE_20130 [Candidatus Sumerlaeaceae bacterium]